MNDACIFCKIAAGEIPAKIVERDGEVIALHDVNPQAPVHVLVMPVKHSAALGEFASREDAAMVAKLFRTAARIGESLAPGGFRTVINTGEDGGQTVGHLHVHVLGGRTMHWPPG